MLYVKADDESILSYGEEVQRRHTVFMPLDLSTVVLGIGISLYMNEKADTSLLKYLPFCYILLYRSYISLWKTSM